MSTPTGQPTPTPAERPDTAFDPLLDLAPEDRLPPKPAAAAAPAGGAASPPPPPAPAPKPQHDPALVSIARDLGFDDAEIATLTPAELSRDVNRAWKYRQQAAASAARPAPASPPPPPAPPKPTISEALGVNLDEYPDDFRQVITAVYEKATAPVAELRSKLDEYEHREKTRHVSTVHEAIDEAFEALAAEYDRVGKGTVREVGEEERFLRRQIVLAAQEGAKDIDSLPPRQIKALVVKAGKRLLGAPAAKPAGGESVGDYGAGDAANGATAGLAPPPKAPARDPKTGQFTGVNPEAELERKIKEWTDGAVAGLGGARKVPAAADEDKPGERKALATATRMLASMNGVGGE